MNLDPVDIALRHIAETRRLIETLVTSSESFDYPRAKQTLKVLQKKTRELARVQAALESSAHPAPANVVRLAAFTDFH